SYSYPFFFELVVARCVLHSFPTRRSSDLDLDPQGHVNNTVFATFFETGRVAFLREPGNALSPPGTTSVLARLDISFLKELHWPRSEEHTSELQSRSDVVCRLLLEKKK